MSPHHHSFLRHPQWLRSATAGASAPESSLRRRWNLTRLNGVSWSCA